MGPFLPVVGPFTPPPPGEVRGWFAPALIRLTVLLSLTKLLVNVIVVTRWLTGLMTIMKMITTAKTAYVRQGEYVRIRSAYLESDPDYLQNLARTSLFPDTSVVKFSWKSDHFPPRYKPNCGEIPYLTMLNVNHCDVTGQQSNRIKWKTQNKSYYAVLCHSRSSRSVPIESLHATSY